MVGEHDVAARDADACGRRRRGRADAERERQRVGVAQRSRRRRRAGRRRVAPRRPGRADQPDGVAVRRVGVLGSPGPGRGPPRRSARRRRASPSVGRRADAASPRVAPARQAARVVAPGVEARSRLRARVSGSACSGLEDERAARRARRRRRRRRAPVRRRSRRSAPSSRAAARRRRRSAPASSADPGARVGAVVHRVVEQPRVAAHRDARGARCRGRPRWRPRPGSSSGGRPRRPAARPARRRGRPGCAPASRA